MRRIQRNLKQPKGSPAEEAILDERTVFMALDTLSAPPIAVEKMIPILLPIDHRDILSLNSCCSEKLAYE